MERWTLAAHPLESAAVAVRLNFASVFGSYPNSPVLAASPTAVTDDDTMPAAVMDSWRQRSTACATSSTRRWGPAVAVSSRILDWESWPCGGSGGRYSGSSGETLAIASARA